MSRASSYGMATTTVGRKDTSFFETDKKKKKKKYFSTLLSQLAKHINLTTLSI
jgi:hypothetical protein